MKEKYIRIRCTEEEKALIKAMTEQDAYVDNMSEYIMGLVKDDSKYCHQVEVFAVVRGINKKKTETVEKGRQSLGYILVDDHNRGSIKQYNRLMKETCEIFEKISSKPNHHLYLEVDGKKVKTPAPFGECVIFGETTE